MMIPYRLRNDDSRSWALYPIFEGRCLAFIDTHAIEFDKESFRAELRARFNDPVLDRHRLYVFFSESAIVGHFLAWLDVAHKRPYIHVHQLAIDDVGKRTDRALMETMFEDMDEWIAALNQNLPADAPRVDTVSWWTWHDPEWFLRYLRGSCDAKISRYVIEYSAAERAARRQERTVN